MVEKKVPETAGLPDDAEPIDYMARLSKNSALHWLPPLIREGFPVPRTRIVQFNPTDMFPLLDGEPVPATLPVDEMVRAAEEIGTPCFLRTDLSSAKHYGPETYRIDKADRDAVLASVVTTFDENCAKMWTEIPVAVLFREWLDLAYYITAFRGHRIAREWRLFVENDRVTERHFYWPWEAVKDHIDTGQELEWDCRKCHESLSGDLTTDERTELSEMALAAVRAVGGGDWSVDFAQDINLTWWLIDMALARNSWRPK